MKYAVRKILLLPVALLWIAPAFAFVDDAPLPKSAPRIKVLQQKLDEEEARGNRVVTGTARIIDAERIKIGDTEVRLFGIIMPQFGAPYGIEARAALERGMAGGGVSCQVMERDRNFHLLAICGTDKTSDIGLSLLQQGVATVARGTVQQTDYAGPYLAAESKAKEQKVGMWAPPAPAAEAEKPAMAASAATASASAAQPPAETPKTSVANVPAAAPPKSEVAAADKVGKNDVSDKVGKDDAADKGSKDVAREAKDSHIKDGKDKNVPAAEEEVIADSYISANAAVSPQEQNMMISLMWFAALVPAMAIILFALGQIALRRYEYRKERQILAAALRGELMAARAICATRADMMGQDSDPAAASAKMAAMWPRLRSAVYQAHVGRIGLLGADLARKLTSLYGQFSDYAQYHAPRAEGQGQRGDAANMRETLFTLIDHIEETLGNLQRVEVTGVVPPMLQGARRVGAAAFRRAIIPTDKEMERLEYVEVEIVEEPAQAEAKSEPEKPQPEKLQNAGTAVPPAGQTAASESLKSPDGASDGKAIEDQKSPSEKTDEKIASATAALASVIEDGEALKDALKTGIETAAKDESKAEGKNADIVTSLKQSELKLEEKIKADAVSEKSDAPVKSKSEAKPDAKTVSEPEPKPEYYDFRSQAVNIAKTG